MRAKIYTRYGLWAVETTDKAYGRVFGTFEHAIAYIDRLPSLLLSMDQAELQRQRDLIDPHAVYIYRSMGKR